MNLSNANLSPSEKHWDSVPLWGPEAREDALPTMSADTPLISLRTTGKVFSRFQWMPGFHHSDIMKGPLFENGRGLTH